MAALIAPLRNTLVYSDHPVVSPPVDLCKNAAFVVSPVASEIWPAVSENADWVELVANPRKNPSDLRVMG